MFFKKHLGTIVYVALLTGFSAYVLLDTFVIPHTYSTVIEKREETAKAAQESENANFKEETAQNGNGSQTGETPQKETADTDKNSAAAENGEQESKEGSDTESTQDVIITDTSYTDANISITLTQYREYDTDIYVADIELSDPSYLQTALAQNIYGRNITAKTSETASQNQAILAINGDYYGAQEKGYVLRNGVLYRNTARSDQEDLVIYQDGSFEVIKESEVSAEELLSRGAEQILSFGPALLTNGTLQVTEGQEVGKAKASNPRTAIGILGEGHYVFVVSDGRTRESEGLSLYELAEFMQGLGVTCAYNLDGGGSSAMYFNGEIVNNPTTDGRNIKERSVSDIVYIGY